MLAESQVYPSSFGDHYLHGAADSESANELSPPSTTWKAHRSVPHMMVLHDFARLPTCRSPGATITSFRVSPAACPSNHKWRCKTVIKDNVPVHPSRWRSGSRSSATSQTRRTFRPHGNLVGVYHVFSRPRPKRRTLIIASRDGDCIYSSVTEGSHRGRAPMSRGIARWRHSLGSRNYHQMASAFTSMIQSCHRQGGALTGTGATSTSWLAA